jgi:hypothetical protein
MRKIFALAIAGAMAIGIVSFAGADESVQTIEASISPKKLSKKKHKPVTLVTDVTTFPDREADPNTDQPPSADQTLVDFPKNMKFDTGAVPKCDVNAAGLEGTTTEAAKQACGEDSQVSVDGADKSYAHVTIDNDPNAPNSETTPVEVIVTAFNGAEKDTIYLHSKPVGDFAALPPSILTGKLKDSPDGKPYGKRLDVTIPDLLAGAIDDFVVTVKAGKYVQARCKSKTNAFQATTNYENHVQTVDTFETKCKQKKKK